MRNSLSANNRINSSLFLAVLILFFFSGLVFSFQGKESSVAPLNNSSGSKLHKPEEVVLFYTENLNLPTGSEGAASLRIYNDRYVFVYYPPYMKRAGSYGLYLDDTMMSYLWEKLSRKEILEFNQEAVREQLHKLEQAQAESLFDMATVADSAITLIEIYPNRYQPTGFENGSPDALKKISWHGLKWDAARYPDISELQDLAIIQQELQLLMQHPDLKRIE